jgi:hypothetical protein
LCYRERAGIAYLSLSARRTTPVKQELTGPIYIFSRDKRKHSFDKVNVQNKIPCSVSVVLRIARPMSLKKYTRDANGPEPACVTQTASNRCFLTAFRDAMNAHSFLCMFPVLSPCTPREPAKTHPDQGAAQSGIHCLWPGAATPGLFRGTSYSSPGAKSLPFANIKGLSFLSKVWTRAFLANATDLCSVCGGGGLRMLLRGLVGSTRAERAGAGGAVSRLIEPMALLMSATEALVFFLFIVTGLG